MNSQIFLFLAVVFAAAGIILLVSSVLSIRSFRLEERMRTLMADDAKKQSASEAGIAFSIQNRELTGSIGQRLVAPVLRGILGFLGRFSPAGTVDTLRYQLLIAGNPYGIGPREFFSIRLIFVILGIVIFFVIIRLGLTQINLIAGFSFLLSFFYGPMLWLMGKVRERQDKIRRGLPDVLDLLTICSSAGLGFDQSLQKVSEHMKTPIALEFNRVISEMEMGLSRKDALRNMANRLQVNELTSFVSFVVQSDQLGMSISETLLIQADQMRSDRRSRAQEQAQKIPTKMLFPMVFLIFPALLAILLGPAMPRFLQFLRAF